MINAKSVVLMLIVGVLLFYFFQPASMLSEGSPGSQCTKVSGTEIQCNFYNRGISAGSNNGLVELKGVRSWAEQQGVVYDTCTADVTVSSAGSCSCGPGSGSYGCPCCIPKQTDKNTLYPTTTDTCWVKFDKWYGTGADCYDNGGQSVSYTGTVKFFIKASGTQCGNQWSCGSWSSCTSYYAQTRECTDECSNKKTETQYCAPEITTVPETPATPTTPETPATTETPAQPTNILDYIVNLIRSWLARININI